MGDGGRAGVATIGFGTDGTRAGGESAGRAGAGALGGGPDAAAAGGLTGAGAETVAAG